MREQLARISASVAAFLLSGCAGSVYGVSNAISFAYPTIGFAGAYRKQLTLDDVRQIVHLANRPTRCVKAR
jgi:hypothetical protein